MSQAVVDDLEAVKVKKEDGKGVIRMPLLTLQRVAQVIYKKGPVRQIRQGIVKGLTGEQILCFFTLTVFPAQKLIDSLKLDSPLPQCSEGFPEKFCFFIGEIA